MSAKNYDPIMHTTEHILNRTMDNIFSCGRSVGTHLEKKKSKCDYLVGHLLTPEERTLIEETVNGIISQNLPVSIHFLPVEQATEFVDISKLPEEAKTGEIRIIQIGDFDKCACIGPHVTNTGAIKGKFKITSCDLINENICRMRWTCK